MSTSDSLQARRYVVRGRVQGVGFRDFTQRCAIELELAGYVRNLSDGTVEAVAMGSVEKLAEFAGLLRMGPRWSEVRGVSESEHALVKASGFKVKY